MDKIRVGIVGLGRRGRDMFSLAVDTFDCAIPAAAKWENIDSFFASM